MDNILILGLGKSGFAALELLLGKSHLFAWDIKEEENFDKDLVASLKEKGVTFFFGKEPSYKGWDKLILSPGVPTDLPLVQNAKKEGAVISGELELAYENCKGKFLAITGTNGKTTTTALVGEMVKACKRPVQVVGNIGLPVSSVAASCDEDTYMVTEVSSFQLETISEFHPKVSAILNITPDHLNRHKTVEEYARIKHLIHKNQTEKDFLVYNADDEGLCEAVKSIKGPKLIPFSRTKTITQLGCREAALVKDGYLAFYQNGIQVPLYPVSALKIPGDHNIENALAACAIAFCGDIYFEAMRSALEHFKGVEHRIEFVRRFENVSYINDSKGTNPDASEKAIAAMKTPILLIAGGYEKNSDFTDFIKGFNGKVKYLLLLGQTAKRFADTALKCGFPEKNIVFCNSMEECVKNGRKLASFGDTVLLSPASASWGMYNNYEERGRDFKRIVNELK